MSEEATTIVVPMEIGELLGLEQALRRTVCEHLALRFRDGQRFAVQKGGPDGVWMEGVVIERGGEDDPWRVMLETDRGAVLILRPQLTATWRRVIDIKRK